jgi:high-affinity iron transporter
MFRNADFVKNRVLWIIIFMSLFIPKVLPQDDNDLSKNVRILISLLDYIGLDYPNAVGNGVVINQIEYDEMTEFVDKAISNFNRLSSEIDDDKKERLTDDLFNLQRLIAEKEEPDQIHLSSNKIKQEIIKLNIIPISPLRWPDISAGKKVYMENCQTCHGLNGGGDGILSKILSPKPANFLNDTLMKKISPFQVYNTITLGISGTSMPAFDTLSAEAVWNTAFYVMSLRYKEKYNLTKDSLSSLYSSIEPKIPLSKIATLSDDELLLMIKTEEKNESLYLSTIRQYSDNDNQSPSIRKAYSLLDETLSYYVINDYENAGDKALIAYLEGVEPYEQQLAAVDSDLKNKLEAAMNQLRSDINNRKSIEVITEDINKSKELLGLAESRLADNKLSFWFSFFLAASIILREGLEAFLIIITILGVLKSINAEKTIKWFHAGWIFALFIGIISFYFTDLIISLGAQNRELMEGIGSLIAVIMLLYVGFWLHRKTEVSRWKDFVENRIMKLVNSKNMIGLAVISFVVVFREAFESVIFLSTININADESSKDGVYLGAILSLIFILILSWIAVKFVVKLPVRTLFKYSAAAIAILAVILAGKGMRAFQEGGYSSLNSLPADINLSFLGIYPTVETLIAQAVIAGLLVLMWLYNRRSQVE